MPYEVMGSIVFLCCFTFNVMLAFFDWLYHTEDTLPVMHEMKKAHVDVRIKRDLRDSQKENGKWKNKNGDH